MNHILNQAAWIALALFGAISLVAVAISRSECINARWIVVAAVAIYLIGYRYYGRFIANSVTQFDALRTTPGVRLNDGLDYVATNKHVQFGHNFAAIAGAGPLASPVLAAQMRYLLGMM